MPSDRALYMQQWRLRTGRTKSTKRGPRRERGEVLQVTCWCEEIVVRVPRDDVLEGVTRSCGRPECRQEVAA